jgi:hypothetical protein
MKFAMETLLVFIAVTALDFVWANRGSLNSAHFHGTDVPVEEPSTASIAAKPQATTLPYRR